MKLPMSSMFLPLLSTRYLFFRHITYVSNLYSLRHANVLFLGCNNVYNATHDKLYTCSITHFFGLTKSGGKKKFNLHFYFVKKKKKNHLLISNLGASLLVGGPGNNLSPYCEIEAINS